MEDQKAPDCPTCGSDDTQIRGDEIYCLNCNDDDKTSRGTHWREANNPTDLVYKIESTYEEVHTGDILYLLKSEDTSRTKYVTDDKLHENFELVRGS